METSNSFQNGGELTSESQTGGLREKTVTEDDASWILTSAFIIFTMQSGKVPLSLSYFQFQIWPVHLLVQGPI